MKTLDEIKENVANEAHYSSWEALLQEIKGDTELIDFYFSVFALHVSPDIIDSVSKKVDTIFEEIKEEL